MNFLEELEWRGLLKNKSEGIEEAFKEGKITGYIGYDPTAASLTIGNLVTIMMLKHLQLHGYRCIVLMGGATGKIGDPSGKDAERKLLDYTVIDANIQRFKKQFGKFLNFEGENAAILLNNEEFYKGMDVFTFLRDIGKNITVNYMMSKDSVRNRIESEQGISFTEFSYQIIQGYDFQYLYEKHGCTLQMGGSDQWGNITSGTHFVSKAGGKAFGITCPLLTKSDGTKFGKSESGNVWLDGEMTSPYQFYQFWLNQVSDADIPKMFKIFSLKSRAEIEQLLAEHLENNPKFLLGVLAEELTIRVHSQKDFESVKKVSEIVFSKNLTTEFLKSLSEDDFKMLERELPGFEMVVDFKKGIAIDELLTGKHETLNSKSDVRRAIGALTINTEKVNTHDQMVNIENLIHGKYILFQNGKKHKFLGVVC